MAPRTPRKVVGGGSVVPGQAFRNLGVIPPTNQSPVPRFTMPEQSPQLSNSEFFPLAALSKGIIMSHHYFPSVNLE